MNRTEHQKQLRAQLEEKLYEQEFNSALAAHLKQKKIDSEKLLAEKVDRSKYTNEPLYEEPKQFTVEGDNADRTKLWDAALKDAAFYFDNPTPD